MKEEIINRIFEIFLQKIPDPKTELEFSNHFTLAVAVILSAQATDAAVNKATRALFQNYDTPEKMLELGEEGLKYYVKTIGLYNSKARNIIGFCKELIEKYNSAVPDNFDALIKLPGVGRKTAGVILNCAFNRPTIPVDTHVFRVARRLGLTKGTSPLSVERDLLRVIPERYLAKAHHYLILHGRYVCKARKPSCNSCYLSPHCTYFQETTVESKRQ